MTRQSIAGQASSVRSLLHAFTLIELLVVITIVVLLLALLAPALDRAMEEATKVKCGANLHVFGVAHPQYAMDHRRNMMTQPRHYKWAGSLSGVPGGIPYGMFPWLYNDTKPPEYSVEGIAPYIGQRVGSRIGEPWLCPSSSMAEFRTNNEFLYNQPRSVPGVPTNGDDGAFIQSEYTYLGAAAMLGPGFSTRPYLLSDGKLGNGVLMADITFKHNGGFLWYNHGEYERVPGGTPKIEGFQRLTGDAAVGWVTVEPKRGESLWLSGADGAGGANMGDYFSHVGHSGDSGPKPYDLYSLY